MKIITIDKKEVGNLNNEEDFKEMVRKKLKEAKEEVKNDEFDMCEMW